MHDLTYSSQFSWRSWRTSQRNYCDENLRTKQKVMGEKNPCIGLVRPREFQEVGGSRFQENRHTKML